MSHRNQIYFVLAQIWYKMKYYLARVWDKIADVCINLRGGGGGRLFRAMGNFLTRVGSWIMGLVDRVRGGGRGGGGGVVDDDGSTMMQGLLMRENA